MPRSSAARGALRRSPRGEKSAGITQPRRAAIAGFGYLEPHQTRGGSRHEGSHAKAYRTSQWKALSRSKGTQVLFPRSRQTIIQPGESDNYNCSVVNFSQGCTTGWHTHDCDQVLVVTSGSGMVATEHEQCEINVGDAGNRQRGGSRTGLTRWSRGRYGTPERAARDPRISLALTRS
jgi:mannose-6-phosphate isomerase-like protein (cupin superfamily)